MVHQSPTQSLHPWIDPMFDISGLCVASWISACFLTLGHRHTRDTSVENIISSEQVACTGGRPGMTIWLGSIFRGPTFILDPIQARKIVVRIESTAKQFKPISDLVGRLSEWNSIKLRIQRQTCGRGGLQMGRVIFAQFVSYLHTFKLYNSLAHSDSARLFYLLRFPSLLWTMSLCVQLEVSVVW